MSWSSIVSARLEWEGAYQPLRHGRLSNSFFYQFQWIFAFNKQSLSLCVVVYVYDVPACDTLGSGSAEDKTRIQIVLIEKGKWENLERHFSVCVNEIFFYKGLMASEVIWDIYELKTLFITICRKNRLAQNNVRVRYQSPDSSNSNYFH